MHARGHSLLAAEWSARRSSASSQPSTYAAAAHIVILTPMAHSACGACRVLDHGISCLQGREALRYCNMSATMIAKDSNFKSDVKA